LRDPPVIEEKRIASCSISIIDEFFLKHGNIIKETPPSLFYGADETMLEELSRGKVKVSEDSQEALTRGDHDFPYISSTMCHSVTGDSLPLFITNDGRSFKSCLSCCFATILSDKL
jgi:hypothetical protein